MIDKKQLKEELRKEKGNIQKNAKELELIMHRKKMQEKHRK